MKLDRLVSILVILLRKERVQAKELAEMFDVSVRTILRDVDAINLAGIPIVTYQGVNGGIGIAEGYRLDRSVLTEDDMAAIITTLKGVAGTIPDSRHGVLMEKIKNTLSSSQLETLNSKVNQFVIDLSPWGGNEHLKRKLSDIGKAIEGFKEIEFIYIDTEGNKTTRRVEPYSLVLKAQKWYVYAWCNVRSGFRLFKLSRIRELTVTDKSFKPRQVSLEQLPWDNERQKPPNTVSLELIFEEELESIVEEWFGEDIVKCGDGRVMVKAALPDGSWLYGFILSFGTGVEVVKPPHIRKILDDMTIAIHKKYSQDVRH